MQKGDGELIAATVAVEALLQAIEEGVWEGLQPIGGLRVHAECLRRSLWRLGEAIRVRNGRVPDDSREDRFGVAQYEKWVIEPDPIPYPHYDGPDILEGD